jgi:hypothetical protein
MPGRAYGAENREGFHPLAGRRLKAYRALCPGAYQVARHSTGLD